MALSAGDSRVRAQQREHGRVIKARRQPRGRCVAESAIGWESRGDVVGIGGPFEVLGMTGVAIRRCAGKHVVDMAA
jgi:hypothetical protein